MASLSLLVIFEPIDVIDVHVLGVGGPDEGLGLLVDEIAGLAGVRIDRDDAEARAVLARADEAVLKARAIATGSNSARITPLDGLAFFTSAIVSSRSSSGRITENTEYFTNMLLSRNHSRR